MIKPDFFTDDDMAEVSIPARLLFIGLWCIADREGRLEDRPKRIKAQLYPYDNIKIEGLLKELSDRVFIVRFSKEHHKYIQIRTFQKHQNVHFREAKSTIPVPDLSKAQARLGLVRGKSGKGPHAMSGLPSASTSTSTSTSGSTSTSDPAANKLPQKRGAFHVFMDHYLKDVLRLQPGSGEPSHKAAVTAAYRRFGRAGKDIMAFAEGDPELAWKGLNAIADWAETRDLSWNLETIAKKFPEWRACPKEFEGVKR